MFLCDKCLNEVQSFHRNMVFYIHDGLPEFFESTIDSEHNGKCRECKSPTNAWVGITQREFISYKRNKTINEIIKNAEVAELVRPQDT